MILYDKRSIAVTLSLLIGSLIHETAYAVDTITLTQGESTTCSMAGFEDLTKDECISLVDLSSYTWMNMDLAFIPKGCLRWTVDGQWYYNNHETGAPSSEDEKLCSDGAGGYTNVGINTNTCPNGELTRTECFTFAGSSNVFFSDNVRDPVGCFIEEELGNPEYHFNENANGGNDVTATTSIVCSSERIKVKKSTKGPKSKNRLGSSKGPKSSSSKSP